jgi:Protein of unknown function (DUF1501)
MPRPDNFNDARRRFLLGLGAGLGWVTAAELLGVPAWAQAPRPRPAPDAPFSRGTLQAAHFPPTAKRVIYMHMLGAVSQADTFDYKPVLEKMHGQELPASVRGNMRLSTMVQGQTSYPVVGPIARFQPGGQSGAMISDLMKHTRGIADDITIIRTMHTEHVNHDPASKFLHTGFQIAGRPSGGAWVNYALGSNNQDLPAFVVMSSGQSNGVPIDAAAWGPGFLPSHYQGVLFRSGENPVPYIGNPDGLTMKDRRDMLDAIADVAGEQHALSNDPEIPSKLSQYEMSYRMQTSVPEVADISDEPDHVLDLYGPDVRKPGTFARNCLLARRLAERDVRFSMVVQLGWDHHFGIPRLLPASCVTVDQASAGLVTDLKQRGMLDDTLVIFATEFGRTSFAQGALKGDYGRDHHGGNFSIWMAGGGVKAGYVHGETDDFSYNIVKDPVHIHDFNATLMRLLGIDHTKLTYRAQGRDFRLTDVFGKVVTPILA